MYLYKKDKLSLVYTFQINLLFQQPFLNTRDFCYRFFQIDELFYFICIRLKYQLIR